MNKLASISSDQIGGHHISERWRTVVCTSVAGETAQMDLPNCDFQPFQQGEFKGYIEYGDIGSIRISRMISPASRFTRKPTADMSTPPTAMMLLQTRGSSHIEQNGHRTSLSPGDWTLYDPARHFSITTSHDSEHINIMTQSDCVPDLQTKLEQIDNKCFGRNGAERIVRDLTLSVFRDFQQINTLSAKATTQSIMNLAMIAVDEACTTKTPISLPEKKAQIMYFIEHHLNEEDLSVDSIAAAFGYSIRQIHRLFQAEAGSSIADHIWKSRLDRSFEALRHVGNHNKTITEIAFSWGFTSSAHFSRAFKKAFGISPSECRNSEKKWQY